MKLVRRASTQNAHSGRKNHNNIHWYYIETFKGDSKLKLVEAILDLKYANDGNSIVEDGCGSTFYISIDQVKQFKEDYKAAKQKILMQ